MPFRVPKLHSLTKGKESAEEDLVAQQSYLVELGLIEVPDIAVNTATGVLPQLPTKIPGVYRGQNQGPAGTGHMAFSNGKYCGC